MADEVVIEKGKLPGNIRFEPTFNLNTVITIVGLVLAGAIPFFVLRSDVAIVRNSQEAVARDLAAYQVGTSAQSARLTAAIDQINQLIITRSADRYTKQDAQRDQDIVREHFIAIENRLTTVENRGIERDRSIDQLQRTMNDISGALKAIRPAPR